MVRPRFSSTRHDRALAHAVSAFGSGLLVLFLCACSGDPTEDGATPAAVALEALKLTGKGDGRACALFSAEGQAQLKSGAGSCEAGVKALATTQRDKWVGIEDLQIDENSVAVDGNTAAIPADALTVNGEPAGFKSEILLARENGRWRVKGW